MLRITSDNKYKVFNRLFDKLFDKLFYKRYNYNKIK